MQTNENFELTIFVGVSEDKGICELIIYIQYQSQEQEVVALLEGHGERSREAVKKGGRGSRETRARSFANFD